MEYRSRVFSRALLFSSRLTEEREKGKQVKV
jgi:hypothetical protein